MTDYIRVKVNDTGHEMTISEDQFDAEVYEKLDRPALDAHGEPAPVKYRTTAAKKAAENKAATSVEKKEI